MSISFSVIIEWENAKLSELARTYEMLFSLCQQIRQLDIERWLPLDLIILYDREAIAPNLITNALKASGILDTSFSTIEQIPVLDKRYYELKNHGANLTKADILVFLDSDVIPEPDWLSALLGAIEKPDVSVVCGNTYIDVHNLYTRAFALFWFFPFRSTGNNLISSNWFFANNVAFRKKTFDQYMFPNSAKMRGQCGDLACQLIKDGHRIYMHEGARVSHPPPNGFKHFIKRALCAGYDYAITSFENGIKPSVIKALRRFLGQIGRAVQCCWKNREKVNLGPIGAVGAMVIAFFYFAFAFFGECLTILAPRFIPRYFPV